MIILKKLFACLLLILTLSLPSLCLPPAIATFTTLTGTFVDASGTPVSGKLILRLPFAGLTSVEGAFVSPAPVSFTIYNGQIFGFNQVITNADILPQNTYYTASLYDSTNTLVEESNISIPNGATFNIGLAIQTAVTTGNISYLNPVGLANNNTFTGSNAFQGPVQFSSSVSGLSSSATQNAIPRFDSQGGILNSFCQDSGALFSCSDANGAQFTQLATYCPILPCPALIGIPWGTLPGSSPGGVSAFDADSNNGMMTLNNGGTVTGFAYVVASSNFFDRTGLSATIAATPMVGPAPASTQWEFEVVANQISIASCTANAGSAGKVIVQVAYTDSAGLETPTVATLVFVTAGLASASGHWNILSPASNNISIQATYTNCTGGTGSYDIHAWVKRVK